MHGAASLALVNSCMLPLGKNTLIVYKSIYVISILHEPKNTLRQEVDANKNHQVKYVQSTEQDKELKRKKPIKDWQETIKRDEWQQQQQ